MIKCNEVCDWSLHKLMTIGSKDLDERPAKKAHSLNTSSKLSKESWVMPSRPKRRYLPFLVELDASSVKPG